MLSCFAMESWTNVCFVHGRAEIARLQQTSRPKSPRKIVAVLEKYVRLVAFTYISPKVDMTASKLFPRKEKKGS